MITSDGSTTKVCNVCLEEKPLEEFSPSGRRADGSRRPHSRCKTCNSRGVVKARAANSDYYRRMQMARSRALTRLAQAHPEEFGALFVQEQVRAFRGAQSPS